MFKVLIVEDHAEIREQLKLVFQMITDYQFNFLEANNGSEALTIIKDNAVDMILCDWNMPNMNGFEFFQEAKKKVDVSIVPFIFVTAMSGDSFFEKAMEEGATAFITKPFKLQKLVVEFRGRLETYLKLKSKIDSADKKVSETEKKAKKLIQDKSREISSLKNVEKETKFELIIKESVLQFYFESFLCDFFDELTESLALAIGNLEQIRCKVKVCYENETYEKSIPEDFKANSEQEKLILDALKDDKIITTPHTVAIPKGNVVVVLVEGLDNKKDEEKYEKSIQFLSALLEGAYHRIIHFSQEKELEQLKDQQQQAMHAVFNLLERVKSNVFQIGDKILNISEDDKRKIDENSKAELQQLAISVDPTRQELMKAIFRMKEVLFPEKIDASEQKEISNLSVGDTEGDQNLADDLLASFGL